LVEKLTARSKERKLPDDGKQRRTKLVVTVIKKYIYILII